MSKSAAYKGPSDRGVNVVVGKKRPFRLGHILDAAIKGLEKQAQEVSSSAGLKALINVAVVALKAVREVL